MPAYNFRPQFAADIASGKTHQTIRRKRKRRTRAGDTLYLYKGMRTKKCRMIGAGICRDVRDIEITELELIVNGQAIKRGAIMIENQTMIVETVAANRFARYAFNGSAQMIAWFKKQYDLPFYGVVIRW